MDRTTRYDGREWHNGDIGAIRGKRGGSGRGAVILGLRGGAGGLDEGVAAMELFGDWIRCESVGRWCEGLVDGSRPMRQPFALWG